MRRQLVQYILCILLVVLLNIGGHLLRAEQILYVNNTKVNLRSSPTTSGKNIITTVPKDTPVTILQQQGTWYQVRVPDGREGWISRWVLAARKTPTADTRSRRIGPEPQDTPLDADTIDSMIAIPAGVYIIGSNEAEIQAVSRKWNVRRDRLTDELEKERFDVPAAFYIDQYEVTNAQYKKFVDATRYPPPFHWTAGMYPLGTENHPVTFVSLDDATEYARWAGKRLPTAEEWEIAARGRNGRLFPWGDTYNPQAVNIHVSQGDTLPAGSSSNDRSEFDVYDMGGNVMEWTMTESAEDFFIVKGGSWNSLPFEARGANQTPLHAEYRLEHIGFRCAR